MENYIDLKKEIEEIRILECFVIHNLRNPALSIEHYWRFSNVKNEADEQQVIDTLLNQGEFSISDKQKEWLEQGLQPHYFDKSKFIKLSIEDRLYRHYDEVFIAIRDFKNYINSNEYLDLLKNKEFDFTKKSEWPLSFKKAYTAYQQAFQFYAQHMDCRSVEIPEEIAKKIKKIQAQAYKDLEIKEIIRVHLKPKYKDHVEKYLTVANKKNIEVNALFDTEIDIEYEKSVIPTVTGLYLLKKATLLNRRERYKKAQNLGSFSYTYMPRKNTVKPHFIKTGIPGAIHIKRLDDRLIGCNETLEKLYSDHAIAYIHKNILQNFYQWKHQIKDQDGEKLSLYEKIKKHYTVEIKNTHLKTNT
ncbi:hypothetical protein [Acinetobacter guillouiae]|uniref:hypothetical protein n=1 Tax=Acinetobacter guillouiae TaxID=106649 RepID=UPI002E1C4477